VTVNLRPHHLLCILTYVGKGYSPAFVANYDRIAERISGGEDIRLVAGPDDICAPLLDGADPHCHGESVSMRDASAAESLSKAVGHPLRTGETVRLGALALARLRSAYANGQFIGACAGCSWTSLCTAISTGGYDGVRVRAG